MATAFSRQQTIKDILDAVLKVSGLGVPSSYVGNGSDRTAIQITEIANDAGQQLLAEHDWSFLIKEHVITTVPGEPTYAIPDDLEKYLTDSQWNRTTRLPVLGALQQSEWQMLKARQLAGTTFTMLFRIENSSIVFYNTPETAQTVYLPYVSRAWLYTGVGKTPTDHIQTDDDIVRYDAQLFRARVRMDFYSAKGFDTTLLQARYVKLLDAAKSKDNVARALSLNPSGQFPYLSAINIPDTGYGGAS